MRGILALFPVPERRTLFSTGRVSVQHNLPRVSRLSKLGSLYIRNNRHSTQYAHNRAAPALAQVPRRMALHACPCKRPLGNEIPDSAWELCRRELQAAARAWPRSFSRGRRVSPRPDGVSQEVRPESASWAEFAIVRSESKVMPTKLFIVVSRLAHALPDVTTAALPHNSAARTGSLTKRANGAWRVATRCSVYQKCLAIVA